MKISILSALCLISVNAKCWTVKCAHGFILRNNGTVFDKDGTEGLRSTYRGCALILHENCDVESTQSSIGQENGECKMEKISGHSREEQPKCAQMHEDIDFYNPHYDDRVLGALINATGFQHCALLRKNFKEMHENRESCMAEMTIAIIISCSIAGGVILLFVIVVVIVVICRARNRKKEEQQERREEMMRVKMQQDAFQYTMNPMMNPGMGPPMMNPGLGPPMMNPGIGSAMNPYTSQANAPYMDPRMSSGMPSYPMSVDQNAPSPYM